MIVSYATANLAKVIGFNLSTFHYYNEKGQLIEKLFNISDLFEEVYVNMHNIKHAKIPETSILAPSISQLQTWLRDEKNICILLDLEIRGYYFRIWELSKTKNYHIKSDYLGPDVYEYYPTYEDALEAGLEDAISHYILKDKS